MTTRQCQQPLLEPPAPEPLVKGVVSKASDLFCAERTSGGYGGGGGKAPDLKTFWEEKYWSQNVHRVAGLDEAGRGAWAGPVVAAAVIFKPGTSLPEIDDSKKLSPQKREKLFDLICCKAEAYAIAEVSNQMIDDINILEASLQAMREAVFKLAHQPERLLIDGHRGLGLAIPQTTIVSGDALSLSIGAASILAKVHRDRLMGGHEKTFFHFHFSKHKGYGTALHQEELQKYGPTPLHRFSFHPVKTLFFESAPAGDRIHF